MNAFSLALTTPAHSGIDSYQRAEADSTEKLLLAFRLLRHHTNNALQQIIVQCEQAALRRTVAGAALADDVQSRIALAARISDALFGLTPELAPVENRLHSLVDATIGLLSDGTQTIRSEIEVIGRCPEPLIPVVLQVVHEMVGNAVLHGMHMRLLGKIIVSLRISADKALNLQVCDDGWGPGTAEAGEGRSIIARLVRLRGGSVSLERKAGWTLAMMSIPVLE